MNGESIPPVWRRIMMITVFLYFPKIFIKSLYYPAQEGGTHYYGGEWGAEEGGPE